MSTPITTTKIVRSPLLAIFIALVFLAGPLPGPVDFVEPASATGAGYHITGPDYDTSKPSRTEISGVNAYAYVVFEGAPPDASEQRDRIRDVVVKSSTDSVGITIDLLETGPETNVFYGGFGFTKGTSEKVVPHPFLGKLGHTGTASSDGKIAVKDGDTVTVGSDTTFKWREAHAAFFEARDSTDVNITAIDRAIVGTSRTITFTVKDADLNKQATVLEMPEGLLRIRTDSDPNGILLKLRESSVNSNTFSATIQFRTQEQPGAGQAGTLWAREGDAITATYLEAHDGTGLPKRHDLPASDKKWTFTQATTGSVLFNQARYVGYTDDLSNSNGLDRAIVSVVDADPNVGVGQDPLMVSLSVEDSDGATLDGPIQVSLHELPGATPGTPALFDATVRFAAQCSGADPCLEVSDGNTVRAQYTDAKDITGIQVTRSTTAVWREAEPGTVTIGGDPTLRHVFGTTRTLNVQVVDKDANLRDSGPADTVTVRAKSTSNPTGVPITLTESSPGVFNGGLSFSTTQSTSNLYVADRDIITVEYDDPITDQGTGKTIRANDAGYLVWRANSDATVTTDRTNYYKTTSGGAISTIAHIYVDDPDQNDPFTRDEVTVTVSNQEDPAKDLDLTLMEVGVDSGTFYGELQFSETDEPNKLQVEPASATATTRFNVRYNDVMTPGVTVTARTTGFLTFWHHPTNEPEAVFHFADIKRVDGVDRLEIVDSYFMNETSGQKEEKEIRMRFFAPPGFDGGSQGVVATLESASCDGSSNTRPTRQATLQKVSGQNYFEGTFLLNVSSTQPETVGPCQTGSPHTWLGVETGEPITATVNLPGIGTSLEKSATVRQNTEETTRFVKRDLSTDVSHASGLAAPVFLRVAGWDHGADSLRREVMTRTLTPTHDPDTQTVVTLLETTATSGVFSTSFQFTKDATLDASARRASHVVRVNEDLGYLREDSKPGHGLQDGVQVNSTISWDELGWWNATDATIDIREQGFGNSPFRISLTDRDGLAHRVFDRFTGDGTARSFSVTSGPYIQGSELVLLSRSVTNSHDAPPFETTPTFGRDPAFPVGDRNHDGVVDCSDVSIAGTRTAGLTGSPTPAAVVCESVNAGTGLMKYAFEDRYGVPSCVPNTSPVSPVTCGVTIKWTYQPKQVASCPTDAGSRSTFEYTRSASGVTLCVAPASGASIDLSYQKASRTVVLRSHATTGSATLETETVTLTHDLIRSVPSTSKLVFSGTANVEVSGTSSNGLLLVENPRTVVDVHYLDPVQLFDGAAGSTDRNHFRTDVATGLWREAGTATIRFLTADIAAPATAPAYGPAVVVEVKDPDASITGAPDTLDVTMRSGGNADATFQLTLREHPSEPGRFLGVVKVTDLRPGDPGANANALDLGCPADNPTCSKIIRATYLDEHSASGSAHEATLDITWRPAATASVKIGMEADCDPVLTPANRVTGTLERMFICIEDADADANPNQPDRIEALVRTGADLVPVVVQLTESGISTGKFTSSGIGFRSDPTGDPSRILARDVHLFPLDRIEVTYTDARDRNGNLRTVPAGTSTTWDQQYDAIVDVDLAAYIGTRVGHDADLAMANITVADGDYNVNPDKVDRIDLSDSDVTYSLGRVAQDGDGGLAAGTAVTLASLIETGANTGIFIGSVTFGDAGATPPASKQDEVLGASPSPAKIPMQNSNVFRFRYTDDQPASGGVSVDFEDSAQWFRAGYGVVVFNRGGYAVDDGTVVVRVYDADLTTPPTVTVSSEQDPDGKQVTLKTLRSGVFHSATDLTISTTGADGALLVGTTDTLTVRYNDDSPSGLRTTTAAVNIGDFTKPVTTMVTDPPMPADPNGCPTGWFQDPPVISFTTNEAVDRTVFDPSGAGERRFTSGYTVVDEGVHNITFYSVDFAVPPNVEDKKSCEIRFDATPPTTSVTDLKARSKPLGAIELSWAAVSGKTNPLEFGSYKVFRGTTANFVGNSTTENFTHTPDSDGTHTYLVAVADEAGNFDASKAVSVSGISDRVAPRMLTASVSPTELFEEIDTNLTVTITGSVNEADLSDVDRVEASILGPVGQGIANVTMTRQGTTNVWRGTFADFSSSGNYTFSIAALDLAGNAAPLDRSVRFHAIDDEPPIVNVPETVVQGTPLAVEVRDNDKGIATISYRLDGGAQVNVAVSGGPLRHTFSIPTGSLALGTHALSITATDLNGTANFATYDRTFTVTDSSGGTPLPGGGAPALGLGGKFVENGGTFQLVVRSQGPLTGLTVSFDGGAAQAVLSSWSLASQAADVNVGSLAAGKHTVVVVATNAIDTTTRSFEIYVLDAGVPLPPSNVQVTRGEDGFPKITWDASPSANVGGYLVHRASSPYKVIKVLDAETTEFTDRTAEEGKTYMYAVTAFSTTGAGRVDEGSESEGELPFLLEIEGSSFTVEEADSNFWTVFWVILILLVVVSAVVLLVVYRERIFRPRGEAGEIYDDDYPDASGTTTLPFGDQQHDLRCPNCTTEFSVTGEKPIVTTCPNCGKKGILR